jgi:hypothetical protein
VDGIESLDGQVQRVSGATTAPARTGVYYLRTGSERVGALVVNVEPEESDLRRAEPGVLADRFQSGQRTVTADESIWRRSLYTAGSRRPLQVPLIVVVLLLLAAETWVVRRAERDAVA